MAHRKIKVGPLSPVRYAQFNQILEQINANFTAFNGRINGVSNATVMFVDFLIEKKIVSGEEFEAYCKKRIEDEQASQAAANAPKTDAPAEVPDAPTPELPTPPTGD
jgi:hypothetical protein